MAGASKPVDVSTKQRRTAELAQQSPEMGFTSLAYFIDLDWLREAYRRTRKDGAVGMDEQSGADYAADLEDHLRSLLDRAESGTYRAPPVPRTYISKAGLVTETRLLSELRQLSRCHGWCDPCGAGVPPSGRPAGGTPAPQGRISGRVWDV